VVGGSGCDEVRNTGEDGEVKGDIEKKRLEIT